MIKKIIKSKTLIFNMLVAIGTVVEANFDFIKGQNPDYYMYIVMVVTAINFYLRTITTKSLDEKAKGE